MTDNQTDKPSHPKSDERVRQGQTTGMSRVLVISIVGAVIAMAVVWALFA